MNSGDNEIPLIVISDDDEYEVRPDGSAWKRANDEPGTSKGVDVSEPKKAKKRDREPGEKREKSRNSAADVPTPSKKRDSNERKRKEKPKKESSETGGKRDRNSYSSPDAPTSSMNSKAGGSGEAKKKKKRMVVWDESSDDDHFKNEYEATGEQILIKAAANCEKYEFLPNLTRRGEFDYCLFRVDALNRDKLFKPIPRRLFRSDVRTTFVCFPWEDTTRRAHIDCQLQNFMRNEDADSFYDVEVLFKNLGVYKKLVALEAYFTILDTPEKQKTFVDLIKRIAQLANSGNTLFPGCLPHCYTNDEERTECSVSMSQEQCACLLANAFFGLFLKKDRLPDFSSFDLVPLLSSTDFLAVEKLRFFINYFTAVVNQMPTGCVSFRRVAIKEEELNFRKMRHLSLSKIGLSPQGIETCHHALQVDFANKFVGGGTFGAGALQEEIRFLCCPEMVVSILLCPKMRDNEAIFIVGAQQFSDYDGYKDSLVFKPLTFEVNQEWDRFRRIRCEIVAIDAIPFGNDTTARDQYNHINFKRELVKAYAGFSRKGIKGYMSPIATGNWGCGAFNGIVLVKFLIQLIAASAAQRDIVYCPFGNARELGDLCYMRDRMTMESISVADLYNEVTGKWKQIAREDEEGGINYFMNRLEVGWMNDD